MLLTEISNERWATERGTVVIKKMLTRYFSDFLYNNKLVFYQKLVN